MGLIFVNTSTELLDGEIQPIVASAPSTKYPVPAEIPVKERDNPVPGRAVPILVPKLSFN